QDLQCSTKTIAYRGWQQTACPAASPASTQAETETGVAAPCVSARAFPDLRDGCRGRTRHGHAVAAALHVAERALRTFHRRYKRRCRGWRQHDKHDEGGEGGDGAHGPSSVAHFLLTPPGVAPFPSEQCASGQTRTSADGYSMCA